LRALKRLETRYTKAGDLDSALAVRVERTIVEKDLTEVTIDGKPVGSDSQEKVPSKGGFNLLAHKRSAETR
jgi:hypothetical protein